LFTIPKKNQAILFISSKKLGGSLSAVALINSGQKGTKPIKPEPEEDEKDEEVKYAKWPSQYKPMAEESSDSDDGKKKIVINNRKDKYAQ